MDASLYHTKAGLTQVEVDYQGSGSYKRKYRVREIIAKGPFDLVFKNEQVICLHLQHTDALHEFRKCVPAQLHVLMTLTLVCQQTQSALIVFSTGSPIVSGDSHMVLRLLHKVHLACSTLCFCAGWL